MDSEQKDALWRYLALVKLRLHNLITLNETLSAREKTRMKEELQDALDEVFNTLMN